MGVLVRKDRMNLFSPARKGVSVRVAAIPITLLAAGFFLRLAAGRGLLWLDEIWSLQNAASLRSPLEVFTVLKHDNNHFLNTLLLYFIGPDRPWLVYRMPAIVAGTAAVAVAGCIGAEHGRIGRWMAMILIASSYLLVHYSSEARGYAWLVLFSLTTYECLRRLLSAVGRTSARVDEQAPRSSGQPAVASLSATSTLTVVPRSGNGGPWLWGPLFSLSAAFGFLAHPVFLNVYVAAVCWSASTVLRDPTGRRELVKKLAPPHALPIAVVLLLYAVNLRQMTLGGGPDYSLTRLLVQTGSLALGGPQAGPVAVAVCCLFVAGICAGLELLRRTDSGQWQFHLIAIGLPVLQSVVARPPFAFVRYYLVSIVFGLMVLSYLLTRWLQVGGIRQRLAVVAIVLYLFANSAHCWGLIRTGRGDYQAALQYMAERTDEHTVRLTSDHHHGIQMLTEFYGPAISPPRRVIYERDVDWNNDPPPWLVLHVDPSDVARPPASEYRVGKHLYRFQRAFDCSPLSGWCWHCYRLAPVPSTGKTGGQGDGRAEE